MRDNPNPKIIEWALNRCGKTPSDLSGISKRIDKWLTGEVIPTPKQMQKLAHATSVLLPLFYQDEIPNLGFQIPDFRTKTDDLPINPSPELYDTINLMQSRQDWLTEYLVSENESVRSFVGSCKKNSDMNTCINKMRDLIQLEAGWAKSLTTDAALRELRTRIESLGVFVCAGSYVGNNNKRSYNVDEFRGFVLANQYAPLIFINTKDAKSAQLFTLVHEFAHLLFNESGVDDAIFDGTSEKKCNAISAEFLVPSSLVYRFFDEYAKDHDKALAELKRFTKVSEAVCLRRAKDLKCISIAEFKMRFDQYQKELQEILSARKESESNGPSFYTLQKNHLGTLFTETIYSAVMSEALLFSDAYRLTGLKAKSFKEYFKREGLMV